MLRKVLREPRVQEPHFPRELGESGSSESSQSDERDVPQNLVPMKPLESLGLNFQNSL
jgi:hypothetical protein